jgi:undecaprenyl-diphosphatase
VFAAAFTALAWAVGDRGGAPFALDLGVHRWAVEHRAGALTSALVVLTSTGTGVVAYAVAAIAGALAVPRRRWWRGLLGAVVAVALVEAVRYGLAAAIARARPPRADWAHVASGSAFPSGHTTTSAVVAAVVWIAVGRSAGSSPWRWPVRLLAVAWALCIGGTRVYLGVHWPTDVLGGWLLVLAVCAALAGFRGVIGRHLPGWTGRR